jgi:hypothetical protein
VSFTKVPRSCDHEPVIGKQEGDASLNVNFSNMPILERQHNGMFKSRQMPIASQDK